MNRILKSAIAAGIASVALLGATTASAAVEMFLKMDGIKGSSKDSRHKDEIEILSFGWEVAPRSGDLVGRTTKVCAHDISFVKSVDIASPLLVSNAVVGTILAKAIIAVRKAGEGQQEFMTIEMNNVLISSVSHTVSASALQLETFTLNFTQATFTIKPQREDGSFDTPVVGMVTRTC